MPTLLSCLNAYELMKQRMIPLSVVRMKKLIEKNQNKLCTTEWCASLVSYSILYSQIKYRITSIRAGIYTYKHIFVGGLVTYCLQVFTNDWLVWTWWTACRRELKHRDNVHTDIVSQHFNDHTLASFIVEYARPLLCHLWLIKHNLP